MIKNVAGILLAGLFASPALADEASLRKAIDATYPKMQVGSIVKTPYSGLYEVYMNGQIIYTDD
ncbi:MAG: disulfide isomerase DsbC N-terminal domain-containing protein, partial [Methylophilaceae bacterium]